MKIIKIEESPKEFKRFRVTLDDGKHYDFGLKGGNTYIDHHDKIKRQNYLIRHMANETEKRKILNLIPSPSLFSALLLWGEYTSLEKNIHFLNNKWNKLV